MIDAVQNGASIALCRFWESVAGAEIVGHEASAWGAWRCKSRPVELGHCEQGERARRFQRLHKLGILDKDLYLDDVLRRGVEYPELKRASREQYARFRPSVVLIEDKASGIRLIQELVQEGLYAVTRYQPQSDKVMRMHAQTAMIENGFAHLPDAAPWLAQYLHEITSFLNGRHDTRSTRPRKCSTGSSAAAAPAPIRGSSNITECLPRGSTAERPGRAV